MPRLEWVLAWAGFTAKCAAEEFEGCLCLALLAGKDAEQTQGLEMPRLFLEHLDVQGHGALHLPLLVQDPRLLESGGDRRVVSHGRSVDASTE